MIDLQASLWFGIAKLKPTRVIEGCELRKEG